MAPPSPVASAAGSPCRKHGRTLKCALFRSSGALCRYHPCRRLARSGPLLLTSIIAVALIIERAAALRRNKILPSGLLASVIGEHRKAVSTRRC